VNSLKRIYTTLPINKPVLTIILTLFFSLFLFFGRMWVVIDDDFVKMFPDNIPSKKVWDEIQEEFGSTEYLTLAVGHNNILNDYIFHDKIVSFSNQLNNLKGPKGDKLIDRVISINNSDILDLNDTKKRFLDYSYLSKEKFIKGQFLAITIIPNSGINNLDLVHGVKKISNSVLSNYKIHFAGQPYLTGETPSLIKEDVQKLMLIGVVIMIAILIFNLRSIYAVLCVFCIIFLALGGMIGFMGWLFKLSSNDIFNFTILSTSMPIILLTIANSDGVHIMTRFSRELRKTKNVKEAASLTVQRLRMPIFLTSLTTAVAFLSMIFSPIPHMIGYGIVVAFGVLWAWVLSTTLLPSLIVIKKWNLKSKAFNQDSFIEKIVKRISKIVIQNPKKVLCSSLAIIAISMIGFWFIKVEVNIIKFFKEDTAIRQSTNFIDNKMNGSMSFVVRGKGDFLNPDNLKMLSDLQLYIEKEVEEVQESVSLADLIKKMNYLIEGGREKIENGYKNSPYYRIPDSIVQIKQCLSLPTYQGSVDEDDFIRSISNIADISTLFYDGDDIIDKTLILNQMKTVSTDRASDIADQVNSKIKSMNKDSDLKFETTGLLVFLKDFVSMVVHSSVMSIIISVLAISFIIFIFLRRVYWAFLSTIPLLSAIILNFGLMGLFGIELSHLTALLTSVIIGVGADFSIHYISDFRNNIKNEVNYNIANLNTIKDVGYPILLDVASNMGFVALLFSAIIPLNYIGGLMVFAMLSTSFGALTILSSVIELSKKRLSS
tara:strand:- start:2327 stop:4639 length:2313 start_codon:yes stop_codon:yes gene_type:complete